MFIQTYVSFFVFASYIMIQPKHCNIQMAYLVMFYLALC